MKRRELREHIFELLFRIEFNSAEEMPEQIRMFFDSLGEVEPKDQQYIEKKYAHIIEKLPEIDKALEDTAEGWKVSRMGKADLTILRGRSSQRGGGVVQKVWRRRVSGLCERYFR